MAGAVMRERSARRLPKRPTASPIAGSRRRAKPRCSPSPSARSIRPRRRGRSAGSRWRRSVRRICPSIGHELDVARGGRDSELRPEHRICNRRAGQRLGVHVTKARKVRPKFPRGDGNSRRHEVCQPPRYLEAVALPFRPAAIWGCRQSGMPPCAFILPECTVRFLGPFDRNPRLPVGGTVSRLGGMSACPEQTWDMGFFGVHRPTPVHC